MFIESSWPLKACYVVLGSLDSKWLSKCWDGCLLLGGNLLGGRRAEVHVYAV